jgi:hypothetical protein
MSITRAPRRNSSDTGHARRPEVLGSLHLVEFRIRSVQPGPEEFHTRLLAMAMLYGSIYRCGIQLWGYNVLSDRVLLALVPRRPSAISLILMNAEHGSISFWERRYSVCPCADELAWRVLRHVDLMAVPDGGDPLDPHALSSAAEHAGLVKHGLLTAPPERLPSPMAWRAFLFAHEDKQFAPALDLCLRTGKPFGPSSFIHKVEESCGRSVGSPCLKWPRLFEGSGQIPNPCRSRPQYATAGAS